MKQIEGLLGQIDKELNQITVTGTVNAMHVVNVSLLCNQIRKLMAEQDQKLNRKDEATDGN